MCWTLTVTGKLWNISPDSITMIDPGERTDSNGSLSLGGYFNTGTNLSQSKSISAIKGRQAYDELWVETFTCKVSQGAATAALYDCVFKSN